MVLILIDNPAASGRLIKKGQLVLSLVFTLIGDDEEGLGPLTAFIDLRDHIPIRRDGTGTESDPVLIDKHMLVRVTFGRRFPHPDEI